MEKKVGQNIRAIRELRNYTQAYMAEQLSVTQRTYSSFENDEGKLTIGRLSLIASILEVSLDDIDRFDVKKLISKGAINNENEKEILLKNMSLYEELHKTQLELIATQKKLIEVLNGKSL